MFFSSKRDVLHKEGLDDLHNQYLVLRHGTSEANLKGIIVSCPENGLDKWGLSAAGRQEVSASVEKAVMEGVLDRQSSLRSSDFLRARESSQIAMQKMHICQMKIDAALRERNFGDFELQSNTHYQEVWAEDLRNPKHTKWGVESATAVVERLVMLRRLEKSHQDKKILLVSHGDTLQLLQCVFEGQSIKHHRDLPHLEVGEVRLLKRSI